MTVIRDELMAKLFGEHDPWGFRMVGEPQPIQGWNSNHPWLRESVTELKRSVVVEIGAWKGASVATMAHHMLITGQNGVVIAVDTWLGSSEHWNDAGQRADLPTLYHQFLRNMVDWNLTEHVIPLRLDSLNAARLLRNLGIRPDMIHLDAGHDYTSVSADLMAWWPGLRSHGALLCDDYYRDGQFPEVKAAIDTFLPTVGVTSLEAMDGKCRVRKIAA